MLLRLAFECTLHYFLAVGIHSRSLTLGHLGNAPTLLSKSCHPDERTNGRDPTKACRVIVVNEDHPAANASFVPTSAVTLFSVVRSLVRLSPDSG